jgi:vacuolar-type H+-ATPase subunit C/Vma6
MISEGYYYLITSLPDLSLTDKDPGYSVVSFRQSVMDQLDKKDARLIQVLYYRYDIENLGTLVKNTTDPWRPEGNFSADELSAMLSSPDSLPQFLALFMHDTYEAWPRMSRKEMINTATTYFIDWTSTIENAFLRKWLTFDHNLKNLLIWLNCRKFGLNHADEVLGNNYEAEYLRSAKSGELNLKAWDFQFHETLRHYNNPNIALREVIINEMRWHYLNEITEPYPFGIEQLLAFAIRLHLINRNLTESEELGNQRLGTLLSSVREGYRLPEIFENA